MGPKASYDVGPLFIFYTFWSMYLLSGSDPSLPLFCLPRAPKKARPSSGSETMPAAPEHTKGMMLEAIEAMSALATEATAWRAEEMWAVEDTTRKAMETWVAQFKATEAT